MKTINVIMFALVAPMIASAQYKPASQLQNNGPAANHNPCKPKSCCLPIRNGGR